MKKRFLGMVTAGILATVMLAGCGASASKVTAESLLQEVQSKCDAMKSLETHTTAEITLESDALGGTMDMTMDMTMQTISVFRGWVQQWIWRITQWSRMTRFFLIPV